MGGRLGGALGPEIFSCSFALDRKGGSPGALSPFLDPNNAYWTDLATDCSAYFARALTHIHLDAVLTKVKIAAIGADGKYTSAPVEKLVNTPGGWATALGSPRMPNSVACKVTLKTNADLGRVKGGFYLPLPALTVATDGRWVDAGNEEIEASTKTFIDDINNAPGADVLGVNVVVASQGRKNADGTVRLAPGNHPVLSVGVGRVPDTIRRRRNKLVEEHDFTAVAPLD
jgi:hypothetical protein